MKKILLVSVFALFGKVYASNVDEAKNNNYTVVAETFGYCCTATVYYMGEKVTSYTECTDSNFQNVRDFTCNLVRAQAEMFVSSQGGSVN